MKFIYSQLCIQIYYKTKFQTLYGIEYGFLIGTDPPILAKFPNYATTFLEQKLVLRKARYI